MNKEQLDFGDFVDVLCTMLREEFPDGTALKFTTNEKGGVEHPVIILSYPGSPEISPRIFLDSQYQEYLDGASLERMVSSMVTDITNEMKTIGAVREKIEDYVGFAKDHVYASLVPLNNFVEDYAVCTEIEGLRVVYRVGVEVDGNTASAVVTQKLLDNWNITQEQLHDTAMRNTEQLLPPAIQVYRMLSNAIDWLSLDEFEGFTNKEGMYMLTSSKGSPAAPTDAIVCLYPGVLEKLHRQAGGDFFLIPASTSEMILIPDTKVPGLCRKLETVLLDVNGSPAAFAGDPVAKQLSDCLYHYSADEGFRKIPKHA